MSSGTDNLVGERGSVYLDFAFIAPFAMMLMLFAVDFCHILRAEIQLEIAARAMADVEAHNDIYSKGNHVLPSSRSKTIASYYLQDALGIPGESVLCKGSAAPVPGMSGIISPIKDFLDGKTKAQEKSKVLEWLGSLIKGAINVLSFGTQAYFLEGVPHDKYVKSSIAVLVPTYCPRRAFDFWTLSGKGGTAEVVQYRYPLTAGAFDPNAKPKTDMRERYHCVMPTIDTSQRPPDTYTRRIRRWCKKWIPDSFWEKLE